MLGTFVGGAAPTTQAQTTPALTTTCSDTDTGAADFYSQGVVTKVDGITTETKTDACDTGANSANLKEYSCKADNTINENIITCPNGCENGACKLPSGAVLPTCAPVSGGPLAKVAPKTRANFDNVLKYCDPLTLGYVNAKAKDSNCLENYECISNVCLDGKCVSIKEKLEEQESLLKQILCALANPVDFLSRDNTGETASNNDYLACIAGV